MNSNFLGGGGGPTLSLAGRLGQLNGNGNTSNQLFESDFPSLTPAQQQQVQLQRRLQQQQQAQQQQVHVQQQQLQQQQQQQQLRSLNAKQSQSQFLNLNGNHAQHPSGAIGPLSSTSAGGSSQFASMLNVNNVSASSPPSLGVGVGGVGVGGVGGVGGIGGLGGAGLLPSALTNDKHGLLGLIDVLRLSTDPDTNMLSLGCELTSLGLNLNSPTPLFSTLASVYANSNARDDAPPDPHFTVPQCYRTTFVPDAWSTADVSDDALLYAFYAFPRDRRQEAAAQELHARSWRFHKEIKVWLTKDVPNSINKEDEANSAEKEGVQTSLEFVNGERGIFVFFDPAHWQRVKKEWIVSLDVLEERSPSSFSSDER
ncbi:UNVERIFIED_CONTAM: hypothetical protein HDU68_000030 [Siphonaria sp. JEL0065]|nr:hypothetical protein HDU68_000030 [Siphonaria sp. JEL0065]